MLIHIPIPIYFLKIILIAKLIPIIKNVESSGKNQGYYLKEIETSSESEPDLIGYTNLR